LSEPQISPIPVHDGQTPGDADRCQNLRSHPYRYMMGKHLVTAKSEFDKITERGRFGRKREEVTGRRGKLRGDELHDQYCTQNIIKVIKNQE